MRLSNRDVALLEGVLSEALDALDELDKDDEYFEVKENLNLFLISLDKAEPELEPCEHKLP